jgi:hypothetical protein
MLSRAKHPVSEQLESEKLKVINIFRSSLFTFHFSLKTFYFLLIPIHQRTIG